MSKFVGFNLRYFKLNVEIFFKKYIISYYVVNLSLKQRNVAK